MKAEITQAIANAALEIFRANEQERRSPVEIVNILQVHLSPVVSKIEMQSDPYGSLPLSMREELEGLRGVPFA